MPDSMIATISSDVATGRRMNGRDGLIGGAPSSNSRQPCAVVGPA